MKGRFVVLYLLFIIIYANLCFAQDSIISFYPKVYAKTQSPPEESQLKIVAQLQMGDRFVNFVGTDKQKVLLVAITKQQLKNPKKSIALKLKFVTIEENLTTRLGKYTIPYGIVPYVGEVVDWGYVFDRNQDGKIDYLAYFVGTLPVKQKDFPEDFPKGDVVERYLLGDNPLTGGFLEVYTKSCQHIFIHSADDNFDGKVDGLIFETVDAERNWVDRWMIIRSRDFDDIPDTCWCFKENIQIKVTDCIKTQRGFWTRRSGGLWPEFRTEHLVKVSEIMTTINEAASKCGLTKDSFKSE